MSYYESDDIEKESDIKLRKQEQQNIGCIINNIQQRITHQLNTMITVEDNLSHIIIIKNFIDTLKSEISAKKHLKLNLVKVISNGAVNELNGALNYLRLKDDFINEQFELLKQKEMNINIRQKVIKGIMNNKIKNINNISSKQYYYTKRKKTPFDKANIKLNNNVQFDNSYKLFMLLEKVITHNNLLKQFIKEDKAWYSKRNKTKTLYRKTKSAKDISKYPSKQYLLTNLDSKSSKEGYSYIRKYSDNVREYDRYKGRTVCYDEDMKYEQVNSTIISKNDMKDVENIKRGIKDKIKSTIRSIHAKGINSDNNNNNNSSVLETPVYTNANISFAGTFGQMKVKLVNTPVCSPPPNEDLRESYSTGQLHLQELKDKISELSKCNNNNNNIEDTNSNMDNECIPKMKSTNDLNTKINDKRKSEINLIKGRRRYINGNSFINVFNRSNNSIQQSESGRHKFLRQNKSLRSNKKTEELNSFLDSLLLSTKKTLEHDNYSQEALATQGSFQIGRFSLTKEHNNTQHEICDSPFARFLKTTTNMVIPQMQIQPSETETEPYNNSNNYILGCSAFHVRTRNNFPNLTQDNKDEMIKLNSDDNINILSNRKLFQSPLSNTYSLNGRKNILADLLNEDDLIKDDNEMNANSKRMMPITENVNVSSSYECECECDDKREQLDEGRNDVGIRSSEKKDTEKSQCLYFENGIPPSHKKYIEEFMSGSSSSFSDEKSYPILISPLKRSTKINFSQFSIDKQQQQHQHKNNVDVSTSSNIINMNNLSVKNSLNCSSSKELIQEIKNVFIHNNNNNNNNSRNIEHEMKVMPHICNTETINESKSKVNNNSNKHYLTEIKHNNTFTLNSNNNNNNNSHSFVQDKFKQLQDKYKINSSSTNKDKKHTRHLSKFNNENSLINSNIHFIQELNFEDNNDNNLTIHPNKYSTNNSHHLKHYNQLNDNKQQQHEDNIYLDNNDYIQEYYSCSHNGQTKNDNKHYITTKHEHNNIIELDFKEEDKTPQKKNITIYLDCSSESNNEDNVNQDIITPQSIPLGIDCCYSQRKYNEHNNNVNQGTLTPQSIPLGIDCVPFENNNNNSSEIMTPQSIPLGINYCYDNNNNNKQESHNDDEMLLIYSIDKTIKSSNSNCLYNGMERYVNVNDNNDKQNVNIEQHDIKAINKEIESNFHDILNSKSSINYNLSLTSSSIISEDHQRCMMKSKEINNESVNVSKYKDNSFSINDQENLHMKEIKEQLTRNKLNNNNNNNNIGTNNQEIPFKINNLCINNNNNKQPLISTTVIDNQDKTITITKETEIPSSPQDPFYNKNLLNNSNYINNQYNGNSELALIEMPSNKANIPKQNTYTYINNSTFSIYSQDNNNNQNNILITESCPIYLTNSNNNNYVEESTVSVCLSGLLDESFESRKTTFHPSKRPYLFPKYSSSAIIHAENDSLHITQPPRKTIGAIITSQNNPLLKLDIINKYHLINLKNEHHHSHKNNLKDIIITENIKKAINHITTNIFKKHIFNLLKPHHHPLPSSNI